MDFVARQIAHTLACMNTTDIQNHLNSGINVTEFSQRHRLPLRTLMRIKSGKPARAGNAKLIGDAIKKDQRKSQKAAQ